ncbi:MAG: tryptophan 7-halogenase [Gammaproteobacteria bacterium]|nr:tryptophan 7-halogenase [Gammaproteobacteria bacterium]
MRGLHARSRRVHRKELSAPGGGTGLNAPAEPIRSIVIVGGGTAGWMTAAAFAKFLPRHCKIRLIESDAIGTVGVGEATIPTIRVYNASLGIDEDDFLRRTQGTFKLGIEFANWGALGESYIHGFGRIGRDHGLLGFHQYWLKAFLRGEAADLEAYSINTVAPRRHKFSRPRPDLPLSPLAQIDYAFHFDAGLYARYLRGFAEAAGVVRTEAKIIEVRLRERDDFIDAVRLESGEWVDGDLFVDCSGFHGLLIEQTLHAGFEDWTHWLPCDRATAVPCRSVDPLLPYTRSTAHGAGWQWRIPLQHRIGNGHVYSSRHISEDEATQVLLDHLDGEPLAEPRTLKFRAGRRRKLWYRNCVAIGLSGGFLEPLESTAIHMIQSHISRFLAAFPDQRFCEREIDEYNRQCAFEMERIRDFIILHYKETRREDTAFWRRCRTMEIPESLSAKLELFRASGRIYRDGAELFSHVSWLQVMHGQGVRASAYHPLVDALSDEDLGRFLDNTRSVIERCVDSMPEHAAFIAEHCAATSA